MGQIHANHTRKSVQTQQVNTAGATASAPIWTEQPAGWQYEADPIYETAAALYAVGLNVFPIPRQRRADGRKPGYKGWTRFRATRVDAAKLPELFDHDQNIALLPGHTSRNLTALDCETPATFWRYYKALSDAGLTFWAWISGGTKGGGGIVFLSADGTIADRDGEAIRQKHPDAGDLEVWGTGRQYVVIPPSMHPATGALYAWVESHAPEDVTLKPIGIAQLIAVCPALTLISRTARGGEKHPFFTRATVEFLTGGAETFRHNAARNALADVYGCFCHGDFSEAVYEYWSDLWRRRAALCDDPANPDRFTIEEINRIERWVTSEPRQPARLYRADLPAADDDWTKAAAFAEQHHWTGKTGATDRAVFMACCHRAQVASRNHAWRASVREIAVIAGVCAETAIKALRRLVADGLIRYVCEDHSSRASVYAFTPAALLPQSSTLFPREDSVLLCVSRNTAERSALGKNGDLVWRRLAAHDRPLTAQKIADLCNLTLRQARYELGKLQKVRAIDAHGRPYGPGLVVKVGRLEYLALVPDDDWIREVVTDPAGVTNKRADRQAFYAAQRAHRATKAYLEAMDAGQLETPARAAPLPDKIGVKVCKFPDAPPAVQTAPEARQQAQETAPVAEPDRIPAHPDTNSAAPALPMFQAAGIGQYALEDNPAALRKRKRRSSPGGPILTNDLNAKAAAYGD